MAFPSPPARRRIIRNGHPRNIRHPIITKAPSVNLVTGAEPSLGRNSFVISDTMHAPSTSPMISGRMYCTAAAEWSPNAPVVSRKKQAIQNPMFAGFPKNTSIAEITPISTPATTIVVFSFFICCYLPFPLMLIFFVYSIHSLYKIITFH